MNRAIRRYVKVAFITAALALALATSQVATAQIPDVYMVDYFSNANTTSAPDATVRVTNPGSFDDADADDLTGVEDLCALIYVFDANQQMSECCGCDVTPDGLLILSVNKDLTSNPQVGSKLHTGVIKIVSSDHPNDDSSFPCDPTVISPIPTMRAWASHIQNKVGAAFPVTEGESQVAGLGSGEFSDLAEDCQVLEELGSGAGVCTCGAGHP